MCMKIMCRGYIDHYCKAGVWVLTLCAHKILGKKCVWTCRLVHLNGLLVLSTNQLFSIFQFE